MALLSCLQFSSGDQYSTTTYKICSFCYNAVRSNNGLRPDANMMCDIKITVVVPTKTNPELYQWFVNGETQSGRILIVLSTSPTDKDKHSYKQIAFTDAYCYALSEQFSTDVSTTREMTLCIRAHSVDITYFTGNVSFGDTSTATNSLKAMVVLQDLKTNKTKVSTATKDAYFIEALNYECRRELNREGFPYGITPAASLEFTMKVQSTDNGSDTGNNFYGTMKDNDPQSFSFVFDTSFTRPLYMAQKESAIVVRGYVVDIKESFDKDPNATGTTDLTQLRIRILLSQLSFIGKGTIENGDNGEVNIKYSTTDLTITND